MEVKKIFGAEDEPDIFEIIEYNLQREGYEIERVVAVGRSETIIQMNAAASDCLIPKQFVKAFPTTVTNKSQNDFVKQNLQVGKGHENDT
jgi:hypothetical protein